MQVIFTLLVTISAFVLYTFIGLIVLVLVTEDQYPMPDDHVIDTILFAWPLVLIIYVLVRIFRRKK